MRVRSDKFVSPVSFVCGPGSGYRGAKRCSPGYQGGSSFVDEKYESEIKQNVIIPEKYDENVPYSGFTVPFIEIKLL